MEFGGGRGGWEKEKEKKKDSMKNGMKLIMYLKVQKIGFQCEKEIGMR